MCIICNSETGDTFLNEFSIASAAIERAKNAMLECSKNAVGEFAGVSDAEMRARYDKIHKKIARMLREWNSIEHEREHS